MMSKNKLLSMMLIVLFLVGCSKDDDERIIEFWTDKDLSTTMFNQLLIDGVGIGTFTQSITSAECGNSANITFELSTNSSIDIQLQNSDNETISFGRISLEGFSSGLSISSTDATSGAALSIDGTSNDPCTTVKMNW